ncbi:hypothetical protein NQ176_g10459 [Zarea fungicola]|uniref:Uncharacterized protein n=1 Tax=Zarea fungicola TaxID=93591 RepID=A0ACC1MFL1_9HYPO|nr:hypothetical protein NQ176_g10459 [Lecanicillium fungicola]
MIMALLYAPHDFHTAMHIINTAGWDTDCNSGNVGCLVAIINGLGCFENGPDWLGPLADRAIISSADGGYSMNSCTRIAYDLTNLGRQLANAAPLSAPKHGAQCHFSLTGGVQGFQATRNALNPSIVEVQQGVDETGRPGLHIHLRGLTHAVPAAEVLTQVFTPPELVSAPTYDLMATPLVNPGQTIKAVCRAERTNTAAVAAQIRIKAYGPNDGLLTFDGPSITIQPGDERIVEWVVPDALDSQPIQKLGVALAAPEGCFHGVVWVDSLSWSGAPRVSIRKPSNAPGHLWHRAWVHGADHFFHSSPLDPFHIAQDHGEGIITFGTRDWTDYRVLVPRLTVRLATPAGLAVRVQGLRRYYALVFKRNGRVALIKARDEARIEIASADFDWEFDVGYQVSVEVRGSRLTASVTGGPVVEATDGAYVDGGIGLVAVDGSVSANRFDVSPIN